MRPSDTALSHVRARARSRLGFNLVEAAIVLGVVGLVIGGIWTAAAAVNEKVNINKTVQGVISICSSAPALFTTTPNGSGRNDTIALAASAAGILPADWIQNGSIKTPVSDIIMSQFNSGFTPDPLFGDLSKVIVLYLTNLPNRYCRQIISTINGRASASIKGLEIGNNAGSNIAAWSASTRVFVPFSGNIVNNCGTTQLNTISFLCQ